MLGKTFGSLGFQKLTSQVLTDRGEGDSLEVILEFDTSAGTRPCHTLISGS
ncbi:hypothetical protein NOCA240046 [metagenome]|uniref:Uncharacterized protein n=1 Tax=metagenome TaxID=256318 RepID=A0A2P2C8Z2_9ZZZZ